VILYLIVSIGIGLYAATKVKNSADFVVAGHHLPLPFIIATVFATWFGSETVLGIPAKFLNEGLSGVIADPFGSSMCLVFVGLFFARPLYRMKLLTIGDFLPRPLQPHRRGSDEPLHRDLLPGLGVGPDHRAGPGVQRAHGRRSRGPGRAW